MRFDDEDNPLAAEIRQEQAASYLAGLRKMVDALESLRAFDARAGQSLRESATQDPRRALLEEAGERVYYLIIQREALRLHGSETFLEDYDVPEDVRACLGPKPRC